VTAGAEVEVFFVEMRKALNTMVDQDPGPRWTGQNRESCALLFAFPTGAWRP